MPGVRDFPGKRILRSLKHSVVDNLEILSGQRNRLTPPKRLQSYVGDGDFTAIGEEFFQYFIKFGNLRPWEKVLDVGSGTGRMAAPLVSFLDSKGSYDGLDVTKVGVNWCNRNIHKRHRNFHFHYADIHNAMYNPNGKTLAREYCFPFPNDTYDFVFLTSVFTHLLKDDVERYLDEIYRVMRPNGRCLLTLFLLNEQSLALISDSKGSHKFTVHSMPMYTENHQILESAIGYDEEWIRHSLRTRGFSIQEPTHYGSWCGRQKFTSYQDIIIIRK